MDGKGGSKIVLACSGASNVGAYSDKIARIIMKEGKGKMLCLARISFDEEYIEQAKISNYDEVIVLDGCTVNCAEKVIEKLEIDNSRHINITDYGIEKGKTPVTEEKAQEVAEEIMAN